MTLWSGLQPEQVFELAEHAACRDAGEKGPFMPIDWAGCGENCQCARAGEPRIHHAMRNFDDRKAGKFLSQRPEEEEIRAGRSRSFSRTGRSAGQPKPIEVDQHQGPIPLFRHRISSQDDGTKRRSGGRFS
jgi:hypothetical protein